MAISDNSKKFFLAAFFIIAADQIIKFLVVEDILNVSYATNTGIAFGFLQGNNIVLGAITLVVVALIIFYRNKVKEGLESAALALVLGGALGNLIDRIFRGEIIDYVTITGIPAFNISDAALTAGAALIITSYIVQKLRK